MTSQTTSALSPLRHLRTRTLSLVAAAALTAATFAAAQTPSKAPTPAQKSSPVNIKATADEAPETQTWTIAQLLPLTVSEAWQMSGKNEDKFFDMVQDLAAFSAEKRGLVLPEDEAAGKHAGEYIKARAKADRNELLYAIVDQAVRKVGTKAPTTATK
jgi:hypothetical protein